MHLGIIKITYNRTAQPRCYHNAFYGRPFREPRRGGNSDFAMTIWRFWISCMYVCMLCLLLTVQMLSVARCVCVCVCVCVCERERAWERDRVSSQWSVQPVRNRLNRGLCVCVCVRERERERDRVTSQWSVQPVRNRLNRGLCVCVCVCERERERERETGSHHSGVYSLSEIVLIVACVQTHTSIITNQWNSWNSVSVTRLCSPLGLELMVKLRTLLTVFTFILKAEARDYGKGRYISNAACGVRPITMHCASWPIRADCAGQKEGLCRKRSVWESRGIEDLQ